jgi:hypothetical protein
LLWQNSRRGLLAVLSTAVTAAVVMGLDVQPVEAARVYPIATGKTPTNGKPIQGGGSWLVNAPSRYYVGRINEGELFAQQRQTRKDWSWGRSRNGNQLCAWTVPGSIRGKSTGSVPDSCSERTRRRLAHRRSIGKDFNAYSGKTARRKHLRLIQTGTAVTTNAPQPSWGHGCFLYYNYFKGNDFVDGHNGGHWADRKGQIGTQVLYRFTTLDGKAAVVRDPTWGWGFVDIRCVNRPAHLWNDDD